MPKKPTVDSDACIGCGACVAACKNGSAIWSVVNICTCEQFINDMFHLLIT